MRQSPGAISSWREMELKYKDEVLFGRETHDEQGEYLLDAKYDMRKVSHMGSMEKIEEHWESMMGALPNTRHLQYVTTFLMDLTKSTELVLAQNYEIKAMLKEFLKNGKTEGGKGSDRARSSLTLKGTVVAKELRKLGECMILEQPMALRGKGLLSAVCCSNLLWADLNYDQKVREAIHKSIILASNLVLGDNFSTFKKAKLEVYDDTDSVLKDLIQQEYDQLKRGIRDLIFPQPLEESGHDRYFHLPILNKSLEPTLASEVTQIEWVNYLLMKVSALKRIE